MLSEVSLSTVKYPAGLLDWAGHGSGGVRQPFMEDSGRPTGHQIRTPLVERLNCWSRDLAEGLSVPRIIFLAGGPGNGKTDAIEGCLGALDASLGDSGRLISLFRERYRATMETVPPRKVVVSRANLQPADHLKKVRSITLIQDATEEDSAQPEKSAEQLLLDDLLEVITGSAGDIYLCCVNRGILASAAKIASENSEYSDLRSFIKAISDAVTNGAMMPQCWPLNGYPEIAVWPMDIESLVESNEDGQSVAHEVFCQLLDESKWEDECIAGDQCPFCQNQKLLAKPQNLDSLITIMRRYELVSGKRWSFRELFSFIAYLLVGDFSELKVDGKTVSPCEWAEYQIKWLKQSQSGEREAARAPFLLASKLYYHRLFPNWPRLGSRVIRRALSSVKDSPAGSSSPIPHLFEYAYWSNVYGPKASGDVPDRIRSAMAPALDPALIKDPSAKFLSSSSRDVTLVDLESAFSTSVKQGINLLTNRPFPKVERELLDRLSTADEMLDAAGIPEYEKVVLRSELRQYAIRLVKRSLGVRAGITKDCQWLDEFSCLPTDKNIQRDVTKTLKNLLQDDGFFKAAVATTFGQPVAQRSKDVSIAVQTNTSIKMIDAQPDETRPKSPMSFVLIQGRPLGVTFDLFKALRNVSQGLHEASLAGNVYALLDRVKAVMTGSMVREEDVEKTIVIEGVSLKIEVDDDSFFVKKESVV